MDVIENCVVLADAVVVPVRTSIFDVGSVDAVVGCVASTTSRSRS
jgi:hypothetical protein